MKYEKDLAKYLLLGEFTKLIENYYNNKNSKINSLIFCPVCGSDFTKKNLQHTFCSLKCKDTFWDNIVEERIERKNIWINRKHILLNNKENRRK